MMLRTMTNGQGYFCSDDTCSGGKKVEDDLLGCGHCPVPILKTKWNADGGYRCISCDKPLCNACAARPPQLKCLGTDADRIERALNDLHRRQQNARVMGI